MHIGSGLAVGLWVSSCYRAMESDKVMFDSNQDFDPLVTLIYGLGKSSSEIRII